MEIPEGIDLDQKIGQTKILQIIEGFIWIKNKSKINGSKDTQK